MVDFVEELPYELVVHTTTFFSIRTLLAALLVSKNWKATLYGDYVWLLQYKRLWGSYVGPLVPCVESDLPQVEPALAVLSRSRLVLPTQSSLPWRTKFLISLRDAWAVAPIATDSIELLSVVVGKIWLGTDTNITVVSGGEGGGSKVTLRANDDGGDDCGGNDHDGDGDYGSDSDGNSNSNSNSNNKWNNRNNKSKNKRSGLTGQCTKGLAKKARKTTFSATCEAKGEALALDAVVLEKDPQRTHVIGLVVANSLFLLHASLVTGSGGLLNSLHGLPLNPTASSWLTHLVVLPHKPSSVVLAYRCGSLFMVDFEASSVVSLSTTWGGRRSDFCADTYYCSALSLMVVAYANEAVETVSLSGVPHGSRRQAQPLLPPHQQQRRKRAAKKGKSPLKGRTPHGAQWKRFEEKEEQEQEQEGKEKEIEIEIEEHAHEEERKGGSSQGRGHGGSSARSSKGSGSGDGSDSEGKGENLDREASLVLPPVVVVYPVIEPEGCHEELALDVEKKNSTSGGDADYVKLERGKGKSSHQDLRAEGSGNSDFLAPAQQPSSNSYYVMNCLTTAPPQSHSFTEGGSFQTFAGVSTHLPDIATAFQRLGEDDEESSLDDDEVEVQALYADDHLFDDAALACVAMSSDGLVYLGGSSVWHQEYVECLRPAADCTLEGEMLWSITRPSPVIDLKICGNKLFVVMERGVTLLQRHTGVVLRNIEISGVIDIHFSSNAALFTNSSGISLLRLNLD